jgi:hypothetical protein
VRLAIAAGLAQSLNIVGTIRSSLGKRHDVIADGGDGDPAFALAVRAQWRAGEQLSTQALQRASSDALRLHLGRAGGVPSIRGTRATVGIATP